jgi:hypothetical protein
MVGNMKATFRTSETLPSRRDVLCWSGGGLAGLALQSLLAREAQAGVKQPHFPAKAKSVILLFMVGGPSQMDLFDPKPELNRQAGKPLPESFGMVVSQFTKGDTPLLGSPRKFAKHGKSGIEMSDLLPELATCVDDMAFLRGCWCTSTIHAPALYEMHTGRTAMGHPTLGSWVTYGLGSANDNLPAFCVMPQPEGISEGGAPCWGAGYLPAKYQGTLLRPGPNPILHLKPPADVNREQQRRTLDLLAKFNEVDRDRDDEELTARIESFELAFRMQRDATEAVDLSRETAATKAEYGLDHKETADFGTRCLLARRLVERGVRFIQLYSGGGPLSMQWDAHDDVNANHQKMCRLVDRPIAALLRDLKRRGMLDETLVVWTSEFGRTPMSQGARGRDHNPHGFTTWLAGGGVKGGVVHGATDDLGLRAVSGRVSINDFHATLLHLLGLDHEKLTYPHDGRDERLTDVAGKVVRDILA